jgi:hypothetical protein
LFDLEGVADYIRNLLGDDIEWTGASTVCFMVKSGWKIGVREEEIQIVGGMIIYVLTPISSPILTVAISATLCPYVSFFSLSTS